MSYVGTATRARAVAWGEQAAARLDKNWLGRVWHVDSEGALLVDDAGDVVRFVSNEIGNGSFYVVLDPDAPDLNETLTRNTWVWRVGDDLWFGDALTVQLPETPPWRGHLNWRASEIDEVVLARRLHWLADTLMARGPEGTFAGVLPDLLAYDEVPDRSYLEGTERLMRWRAARVLDGLMPALEEGNMVTAETLANRAAGLGPGAPPAGDHFLIGLIAGLRLWPHVLERSGLHVDPVLQRMAVGAADRTSLLGWALIQNALVHDFGAPWHDLSVVLHDEAEHAPTRRKRLRSLVQRWLDRPDGFGTSGLAGFLLPFLWDQRQTETSL